MRVQLIILSVVSIFVGELFSQTKIPVKDSTTLNTISDVVVSSKSNTEITDNNGYFDLSNFRSGDTLSFQHILYKINKVTFHTILTEGYVLLKKREIRTEEITINGSNENLNLAVSREIVKLDGDKKAQYAGIDNLIKNETTLFIKDYGGYAGLKTVSSRGMSSENTVVLFNEARVNDLRTGTFNFAEIDSRFIDQIEYSKNSSFGLNSAGGTVKLYSGNELNENSLIAGANYNSNNIQNYFTSIKGSNSKLSYSLNMNRAFSNNHYNYKFEGQKLNRENSDFSKTFLSGNIGWKSNNSVLKLYLHYSHLLNGLPGFVVTNNYNSSNASNLTNSFLSILNFDYVLAGNISFSSNVSFHNQLIKLIDPQNQLLLDRKSQSSTFNDIEVSNKLKFASGKITSTFGYLFHLGSIDSLSAIQQGRFKSDFTRRNEHLFSASIGYGDKFSSLGKINFSGSTSFQYILDNFISRSEVKYFSYRIGFELIPEFWRGTKFIISYANNYRHPSFNEKYYSSLFSAQSLDGEKYRILNAGIGLKFDLLSYWDVDFTYFSISGENKIIWIPTRLALQVPHNISKISSSGIELSISKTVIRDILQVKFLYSFVNTKNKTFNNSSDKSYNKQLIYTPKNRWNFNAYFNYENFNININSSFVGESFYTADNNPQNRLDNYFLLDASIGFKFNISNIEQKVTLNAYNLLNENYFIIQSYPMPLSSYSINYQMRL